MSTSMTPFLAIACESAILMAAIASVSSTAQANKVNVFLLGGQSNADGRAGLSGLPLGLQASQEDVGIYFGTASNGSSTLNNFGYDFLQPGFSNSSNSFGPEVTFGRAMADFYAQRGEHVALIKHAQGGTGLVNEWRTGGDATTNGDGFVYDLFQQVVTDGLASIGSEFPPGGSAPLEVEIAGMIWMQGERDSNLTADALAYESSLTNFIGHVRATYDADLPFVVGQLSANQTGTNGSAADREIVRAAQAAVVSSLPETRLVVTDSFGLNPDNLHFSASGQQDLGNAFASQMQGLLSIDPSATTTRFDFGFSGGATLTEPGWIPFEVGSSASGPRTTPSDPASGISVTLASANGSILGRDRDPLDAATGGTFTLDNVYVDFITALETVTINNLDPANRYDVQLIMFDDQASDGRTQTVTNVTRGFNSVLGTSSGPGGANTLNSD